MLALNYVGGNGQHNSCVLHKRGRGHDIRVSLFPPRKTALMVQPQSDSAEGQAHTRIPEHDSGQAVQTLTGD